MRCTCCEISGNAYDGVDVVAIHGEEFVVGSGCHSRPWTGYGDAREHRTLDGSEEGPLRWRDQRPPVEDVAAVVEKSERERSSKTC